MKRMRIVIVAVHIFQSAQWWSMGRVIAILWLCIGLGSVASCSKEIAPDTRAERVQGWTEQERRDFYHTSQGTRLIPYAWFMVLEQIGKPQPFRLDENLAFYGFIPDRKDASNPDGLPIGFTKTIASDGRAWLGLNCAACHTGQITYKGRKLTVDGGASLQNNILFMLGMTQAVGATLRSEEKFSRFAQNVLGPMAGEPEAQKQLRGALQGYLAMLTVGVSKEMKAGCALQQESQQSAKALNMTPLQLFRELFPDDRLVPYVEGVPYSNWGYGRLDALGRGRNTVFVPMDPCNLERADAPVSIPKVWYAWKYDWVQWNGSVENPLARNLAQAVALGAIPVDLKALDWFEMLLHKLTPPSWPEAVLGAIDREKAARGKDLYGGPDGKGGLCAHCHVPKEVRTSACDGKDELAMNIIPYSEVGTDVLAAAKFSFFPVRTGSMEREFGQREFSQPKAMERITSQRIDEGFARQNIPDSDRKRMQRCRGNRWQSPESYKAPTHEGVWTTAPYLHNGSVPNLYQLLLPAEQRDGEFCVGPDVEFDPKRVGLETSDRCDNVHRFSTDPPGNDNRGHEFRGQPGKEMPPEVEEDKRRDPPLLCDVNGRRPRGILGCEIKDEDRWAIIEYLKTL